MQIRNHPVNGLETVPFHHFIGRTLDYSIRLGNEEPIFIRIVKQGRYYSNAIIPIRPPIAMNAAMVQNAVCHRRSY